MSLLFHDMRHRFKSYILWHNFTWLHMVSEISKQPFDICWLLSVTWKVFYSSHWTWFTTLDISSFNLELRHVIFVCFPSHPKSQVAGGPVEIFQWQASIQWSFLGKTCVVYSCNRLHHVVPIHVCIILYMYVYGLYCTYIHYTMYIYIDILLCIYIYILQLVYQAMQNSIYISFNIAISRISSDTQNLSFWG